MSYSQYPGGYQPYPQGLGGEPSSATAVTAGVLAALGAAGQILGGVVDVVIGVAWPDFGDEVLHNSWFSVYMIGIGVIGLITGGLLAAGAVLVFRRRVAGRIFVVAGCVVTIVAGIGSYILLYGSAGLPGHSVLTGGVGGVVGQVFPVLTAVLALVPSTGRWLAYVPQALPGYAGPGVAPGYPVSQDPFNAAPYGGQHVGQPVAGAAVPYGGQPGSGAVPYGGQPGSGVVPPDSGQPPSASGVAPQASAAGPLPPYSNEPTPFPEVPPLGSADDQWRRQGN
ncbi:DUF4064 domain-containing protein [Nocardia macrotermitis]|uniref:Uncharacterized protein n=1 Tax=Nocardia macrotermitis TaxID=2585198 RepID=A0A7K0DAN7_9NOCA|nr:DUF4064 domain-containing protein [Nocardia macrotermitis]MQY22382.1 hypothetical protein [Nocardia macrotermitis]